MTSADPLCARCARAQRTCCQTSEVYTTLGDVERIGAHTGEAGFTEYRAPDNPAYLDQDDDPVWLRFVFRPDRTRRILRRRPGGDCTFLGERGCRLPLDVRPLVCRLYPYDYGAEGIRPDLQHGCPTQLLRGEETLLSALSMDLRQAEGWQRQLYAELAREAELEDRADLRPQG